MLLFMKGIFSSLVLFGNIGALVGFWVFVWFYRALMISFSGGIAGLVLAPFIKLLFFKETGWVTVFKGAFVNGFHYVGLWASAIALVWVIMDRRNILDFALSRLGSFSNSSEAVKTNTK